MNNFTTFSFSMIVTSLIGGFVVLVDLSSSLNHYFLVYKCKAALKPLYRV